QIPLVPQDCRDLDRVVSPALQASLPIIRITELSPPKIIEAWHEAIARFDDMGAEGIETRHAFARDHHHISARISQILQYVQEIANSPQRIGVKIDEIGVGLVDASLYG